MCLGMPGQVIRFVDDEHGRALVSMSSAEHEVSTAMLADPGLAIGDWVIVHAGFAVARADEREALGVIDELQQLEDWYAQELGQGST